MKSLQIEFCGNIDANHLASTNNSIFKRNIVLPVMEL